MALAEKLMKQSIEMYVTWCSHNNMLNGFSPYDTISLRAMPTHLP